MKFIKNNWLVLVGVIAAAALLFGLAGGSGGGGAPDANAKQATLYKSPDCGCCVKYTAYMKRRGYDIKTVTTRDMAGIKNKYNIPSSMESCHTMVVDGYVVEGHIPVEVVDDFLAERPQVDGIALPDMPAGTPGMPGMKRGDWSIFALKDGSYENYLDY